MKKIMLLGAIIMSAMQLISDDSETKTCKMEFKPAKVPPGGAIKMIYNWEAKKRTEKPYKAFVHIKNAQGKTVMQADHNPPVGTSTPGWIGKIQYDKLLLIPEKIKDGTYKIILGLYNKSGRMPLKMGEGVTEEKKRCYYVGDLIVDSSAPFPKADTEKPVTLDLSNYELTFSEEFDKPLDVSAWGPGTRWIAHTPWDGDFGDARFADPEEGFPFVVKDGILQIICKKKPKSKKKKLKKRALWASGLLASNDPNGKGFSQQYGYFEIKTKLPPGPGVWPAFWLTSSYERKDKSKGNDGSVEIDIFEYYGRTPSAYSITIHTWKPKPHTGKGTKITTKKNECSTGFHTYGCLVEKDFITFYFDGKEVWKTETPEKHNKPLMVLLNLALGPGWPIDKTPNPSIMKIDYVRVYNKKK